MLSRFFGDRRGNVAPIFAIAMIPVLGLVGMAVDYSRGNSVRAALQAALDATALAMARSAPNLTAAQLQQQSSDMFFSNFNRRDAQNIVVTATYSTTNGSALTLGASGFIETTFTRIMGVNQLNIGSSSTIKWGNQRLRVALVLDTTGSMASAGKIDALKTATKNLIDQLKNASSVNGDVYISIIPFSKDANVGSSNRNASWMLFDDGTDKSWDGANGTCSRSGYSPRSVCQGQGTCSISGNNNQSSCTSAGTCSLAGYATQSSCTSAGTCSNPGETTQSSCTGNNACTNASYSNRSNCQSHGGTWGRGTWTPGTWTAGAWTPATWTPNNHTTWNGCVTDRGVATPPGTTPGNDQTVIAPSTGDNTTLFYAEQYSLCSPAVMGLSYDWNTMKTAVDNLTPNGNTNQNIGLAHGWMSLVGGGPYSAPAKDPNYIYNDVIILLTDGLNTQDRWYTDQASIDARQQTTCDNVNAANINLYTIQVNTGGDPVSNLLKNCAGTAPAPGVLRKYPDPDKNFVVTSSSGIGTIFNQIGTKLSKLRIAY
ncbi:MAG TPA: pilus assembly protein [Xanthobacteraceae bacterium]|nr:pilus assembly protein [Xanthobacteraceae bacterium]